MKDHPSKAAVAIILKDGDVLIGKKRKDPNKWFSEKWHLPGETLELGENYREALRRGVREETGIEVEVRRQLASDISPTGKIVRWYECTPLSYNLSAGNDLTDVLWVKHEEVPTHCKEVSDSWPQKIKEYFGLV